MDFEAALISRAILKNEVGEVIDANVKDEYFVSHHPVWDYVRTMYIDHGCPPPLVLMSQRFPDFRVNDEDLPLSLLVDEVRKRFVSNSLREGLRGVAQLMQSNDPYAAYDSMKDVVLAIEADRGGSMDVNLVHNTKQRVEDYHELASCEGMIGIPTPWRVLDKVTLGLQSEDLIMVAGRSNVGKTWSEIVFACHAWTQGYVPLLISNEMSVKQIVRRIDATAAKVPYKRFRAGQLSAEEYVKWESSLKAMQNGVPFWVSGNRSDQTVTGIRAKIRKYKPSIVWIDGGYLIEDEKRGRQAWERWSNVCAQLKRLAQDEQVPIGLTHQFNLDGKDLEGTADTLKYGDVKMWFDLILGMYQPQTLRRTKEMLFRVLKVRESEDLDMQWVSKWDLDSMVFEVTNTEPPKEEAPVPMDY